MNWLDWVLIVLVVSNIGSGFAGGLIYKIGTVLGGLIGLVVAGRFYNFFHGGTIVQIASFVVIFAVIANLVGLFFKILNQVFNFVAIIPGMKFLNRLGGAALGVLEGAFFLGLILLFVNQLNLAEWAEQALEQSRVAASLMDLGKVLVPLFPEELRKIG